MGKKNKTQRVVGSADEARQAAIAEQMKNRGGGFREKPDASFESIYGSATAGSFDIAKDLKDYKQISGGMVTDAQVEAVIAQQQNRQQGQMIMPEDEDTTEVLPVIQMITPEEYNTANPIIPDEAVMPMGPEPEEELEEPKEPLKPLTLEEKAVNLSKFIQAFFKDRGMSVPVPSPELIIQWKQMHGDIHMLPIADRIFLFRYIKRQEYIQMMAADNWDKMREIDRDEIITDRCLLYPQLKDDQMKKAALPANTLGMIAAQIKLQSLFLDEMYVSSLVMKI